MKKSTANFFGKKDSKKPSLRPPAPSLKPPQIKKKQEPKVVINKNQREQINVSGLIAQNYSRSKLSKEDEVQLFNTILNLETLEDIENEIENYVSKDVKNSYTSEILYYILQNFTLNDIKFIGSLFVKTDINTLALFSEKYLFDKENIKNTRKITKFIKSLSFEDDSYIQKLKKFGEENVLYKSLIKEISENLSKQILISFLDGFINQGTYLFNEYYSKVFVRENKKQILDYEKLLRKQKEQKEHEKTENLDKKTRRKKTIQENERFLTCKNFYKKIAWVSGSPIVKIYLSKPSIDDVYSYLFEDFIENGSKLLKRNVEWFEVNDSYFKIQCDESIFKVQKGDILYFVDVDKKLLLALKIAFLNSDNEFIIQDEGVFNSEKTFFANIDEKLNDYTVNKILDDQLSDEIVDIGKTIFRNALGRISTSSKYDNDVRMIIEQSKTIRDFAINLGNVLVYFDLDNFGDSIFKKRIQKEYYNSNSLFNLSNYEKLPELVINDQTYFLTVNGYIDKKIHDFTYRFGEDVYIIRNKFTKDYKRKQLSDDEDLKIEFTTLNKYCQSSKNVAPENLILYKESGKISCHILFDLINQISSNQCSLSQKFKNHLKNIYDFESNG